MARTDIADVVARVLTDTPLPADVDGLDPDSRRALEREAERQGVTPSALLAAMRARRRQEAEAVDPAAIARAARR